MRGFIAVVTVLIISGCITSPWEDGRRAIQEDFENVQSLEDLLASDNWTFTQQQPAENTILIDSTFAFAGNHSAHFSVNQPEKAIHKCDIANNKMTFYEGETVNFSAWFFLAATDTVGTIFLYDLEEGTPIGATPGVRIYLNENGEVVFDRSKMNKSSIYQDNPIKFPLNQWVKLDVNLELHRKKKGSVEIRQNNQIIIQANDIRTMPTDFLYATQGTKGIYNSVEVGITATQKTGAVDLWVDEVSLEVIPD